MKASRVTSAPRSLKLSAALILSAALTFGAPPVLRWDPSVAGNVWNATATNWLDSGASAVAWIPGAEAKFESASGGLVQLAADVSATNLTFTGSGYTLLGAGRLSVEGSLACAAATTNCIAADLVTVGGLTKTGVGALALARCAGPLVVQVGSVLASGSAFVDADLSVASGAALVTLGDPATNANLIANSSFETPPMASGAYQYVAGGNVIDNWSVVAYSNMVARQNTVTGNAWNSAGASPHGVHMLILQYGGAVAQTVTVPADGLYALAFSYLRRQNDDEHQVYVWLDGVPLATFLNRNVQFSPGRFVSGALWLNAGSHSLCIGGEHSWDDRSTMVDAVCFSTPSSASPCGALGGDSLLKVVSGASVTLEHSGAVPLAYVAIDGESAAGTFDAAHSSGLFSGSGALSCAAPGNVYAWSGTGLWSESARWADGVVPTAGGGQNLLVRFPAANGAVATNDLEGMFLANGLWASGLSEDGFAQLEGNALVLTNSASGRAPRLKNQAPGAWTITAPVHARAALTLETAGDLIVSGHPLTVLTNQPLIKTGPGTAHFPGLTNAATSLLIYEGTVQTPRLPVGMTVNLLSQTDKYTALCLTEGDLSFGNRITLRGSGTPVVLTRCGGGTLTGSDWMQAHGDVAVFDMGVGDTLSLRQMLSFYGSSGARVSNTKLLKTGPGTLEIRSGGSDSGENRAYRGQTVLRSGTLRLTEDDWGTLSGWTNPFNGRTYPGTGGSLGYHPLTNAVLIGDGGTAASDELKLLAGGDTRWIGHDIEVFNRGDTVMLGMTAGTAMFGGTLTLHRDITLSGPADGVLVLNNVVTAGDFSGNGMLPFSGLAGLCVEGSLPASFSLIMGNRRLSFGISTVRTQTLHALTLGNAVTPGSLDVDFGAGVNDVIAVSGGTLTLSNTLVNLYYAGTGMPFAEPGTYTLFTYGGTLGGDAALLSVGNPQSGASYVFADDAAHSRVTLTISGYSGGVSAVWTSPVGGNWGMGANWVGGGVPNGSGVVPLFGLAITNAATVDTGAGYTVGGLLFNNAASTYTLEGSGGLTLATNGAVPKVTVNAGTHALDTAVSSADGFDIATASDALLVFGPSATANSALTLSQGSVELRGNAVINGATSLADATLLRASSTTNAAIGTLSGASSATVALTGTSPKFTVNQASDALFAGSLSGLSVAQVVKAGAGTLTLTKPLLPYQGTLAVESGTLALQSATVPAVVLLNASGTLNVSASVTNGLMGYYYTVTPDTNAFWTLAGMESHFAALTPNFVQSSGTDGALFDYGVGTTFTFPAPYGSGGSRSTNFETVWRGVITVPESGAYTFGIQGDDGYLLAVGGRQVLARNNYSVNWTEGLLMLDAGRHDIVLGYFQQSGGGGVRMRVRCPSQTTAATVSNAALTPYAQVNRVSGVGGLAMTAPDSVFRVSQSAGLASLSGTLTGVGGSLLTKAGNGLLRLAVGAANAFTGDLDVQGGLLALDADAQIGDASTLAVRAGATLALAGTETVGAVAGSGTLALGGFLYALPFTGDADSDISTAKTYTHRMDFPLTSANPTVNGVAFNDLGTYTGTLPTGAWNETQNGTNEATVTGMDSLLWDFSFGSTDFTFNLTGLTEGRAYELRMYFRNFANNPRNLIFTFTAGERVLGSISHNPDSITRSIVGCRYVADSAKSLTVRVISLESGHSCHLYGLSNEELTGATAPVLTLAPLAGRSASFTGPVSGLGELVIAGDGTQRFGGVNSLSQPLAVASGTAALDSGSVLQAGAAVAAGAVLTIPSGNVTLGSVTGEGLLRLEGGGAYPTNSAPYLVTFTNDAGSGISPDKVYTHKIDFGASTAAATVNGVTFLKTTAVNGVTGVYGWTNAPPMATGGRPESIGLTSDNGMYNLLNDMNYNMASGQTLQLTGLTVGKWYEVRLYNRTWDPACERTQTFTFDPDGAGPVSHAVTYDFDVSGALPNYLGYRYYASTGSLLITITRTVPDSYHLYGFTNEESGDGTPGVTTLAVAGDCVFDGTVTGPGAWLKTGAGSFTATGVSDAIGPLTVAAGAFGVAANGRATLGPVGVLAGATLFGHGQVGGTVTVASNAWLQAGSAAACGTLAVGGDLTVMPGARLAWRYAAGGSNDTVTVGGLLTFPTNGTVQVSTLTTDLMPPAKALFFASPLPVNGPADLTGWTVAGVENASLRYSEDRTKIFFFTPRGLLILLH